MATVPENQVVDKVPKTLFNDHFANLAASICPELQHWDRSPQRLIKFEKDDAAYFGLSAIALPTPIGQLFTLLWGKKSEFVVDFGIHLVGRLSFHLEAEGVNVDAPCRLRLTFGESPFDVTENMDTVDTWISTSWLPDETINVDFMPDDVSLPRRYSFRYVRFQIVDTSPKFKVKFSNIVCKAVSAIGPDHPIEVVDYNDPLLQSIDQISIFTLRDCMQTVFEDGPRRDRRLWIGDLRLQALTNYCTFKDYNLVKRCLLLFAALPREDMSLPACLFERPTLTPATDYIVDYDTLFGVIVYDYVVASGDLDTGHMLWPTVLGSLLKAISHLNPETHVFESSRTKAWKFLDWAEDLDTSAGMHGVLLYSLRAVQSLSDLLSLPFPHSTLIDRMTDAASLFISKETNLVVSGPQSQISLASAAWLVLSSSFSLSSSRHILLTTLSHPHTVKPTTPYLYHHICDALASVHLFQECISLMKTYWGGMVIAGGADTFWESFDPDNARASPYGDVRNNSFCHAWSCTPSWLLRGKLKEYLKVENKSEGKRREITMGELDEMYIRKTCG